MPSMESIIINKEWMNLKIVGIPGSNANHSYNRMLLEYISKAYEHDMTVVDVRKIPLFNESAKETPAAIHHLLYIYHQ